METVLKSFEELSPKEIHQLYKLRVSVFVVEQNCAYQEIDDWDPLSLHLFLKEKDEILGYLRIHPPKTVFETPSLGRVIVTKRRQGIGTELVRLGIEKAIEAFHPDCITIEAQAYARRVYENNGFVQSSEEFLEDGIPHIQMKLNL